MTETKRSTIPAAEELIGVKIPCLDQGFVYLVEYMGGDAAIVQAARISYGAGTKSVSDDRGLIRYLVRNRHTTPLEMVELKFHVRIPMDSWRQMVRHRTASINEYSTRYSEAIDAMATTAPDEWRLQAKTNRQGSSGEVVGDEVGQLLSEREQTFQAEARAVYEERLRHGVAREVARKDLPLSTYTEAYWKIDLHNLLHFLGLRLDLHAQKEIRDYAEALWKIAKAVAPMACEAFEDFRLEAMTFSKQEVECWRTVLQRLRDSESDAHTAFSANFDARHVDWKTKREREEFEAKLTRLIGGAP